MLATPIFTISSTNFNSQKGEYLKQYASALENRHLVLAKRLVELERVPLRAQIRDPFEDKETPALFFTIKTHFHEMFDYLIAKGHENEEISRDSEGNTVLMIATQYENEYVLYQYLSLYPKSIHVKNNRGESAMAVAARYGNAHVVQLLIHLGADVNVRDNEGSTPLHEASAYGHLEVSFLRCEFNVCNQKGCTPLDYAYSIQTAHHLQDAARQRFERTKEMHRRHFKEKRSKDSLASMVVEE